MAWVRCSGFGGCFAHGESETYGHGVSFLPYGKVSPSRAKIMGVPIEVKETAAVST